MTALVLNFVAMKDLPNRLREWRKVRGYSLERVAGAANCSVAQISDLERGNRQLNIPWMRRLAPILGVEPAQLLLAEQNSAALSEDEHALIERFRAATDDQREQLVRMSDVIVPWRGPAVAGRAGA